MSSIKKRTKKPFDELTITDNYMFQTVMTEPKHVRPLLEMVIGKKIRKIDSFIIFITTYDPFDKGWYMYPFETICTWDSSVKMKDHAKRIILNTKGTNDKEGHEVSDEIKGMLSYMDGNTPDSDYAKMLDDAVKKVKDNQERRNEYMNLNLFAIDERVIGKYSKVVEQIRNNNGLLSDEMMVKFMNITPEFLQCVREAIENNPDWDDEDVADYAISETESD